MKRSSRLDHIAASETMAITARAAELRKQGHDVVSFGAGEPDFTTPAHIIAAMSAAAERGATRYPPLLGIPELRAAAAKKASARYQVAIEPEQVVVTPGAKLAIWAAFQLLVDTGDEVLVPTPCWVSYAPQIALAGGRMVPVPLRAEVGFRLDAASLERALTPRTVGIVLNLPNNPTGAMAAHDELAAVAALARERDLWLLSDDIYADLRFDPGPYPSPLLARPELRERTFIVDGPSKSHGMTGWRVGYAIAPHTLVPKLGVLLGQTVTGVTHFAQYGAVAALEGDNSFLNELVATYRRRAELVVDRVAAMGLTATRPEGAFYTLLDVRRLISAGAAADDTALAARLLQEHHLVTVPGSAFLAPGFLRLSFACADDRLRLGLDRLASFVAAIDGAKGS